MELILISPTIDKKRVIVSQWKDGRFCLSVQTYHNKNWSKRSFNNKKSYIGYSLEKASKIFEEVSGFSANIGRKIAEMKKNEHDTKNI